MIVDAEDALIAALKAKADQPGATIANTGLSHQRHGKTLKTLSRDRFTLNGESVTSLQKYFLVTML